MRTTGRFAAVRVAFWKEEPLLHYAFDLVETPTVYVVPVLTSEGYFTDQVLPREMGLEGTVTARDGRHILYCPPLGTHPKMAEIVLERAAEAAIASRERAPSGLVGQHGQALGAPSEPATLVVVGHGTDRHPTSGDATIELVDRVLTLRPDLRVLPAFLDQTPTLLEVLRDVETAEAIVVPFFISEGWHVGSTIPDGLAAEEDLGLPRVLYAPPVGTHPAMADMVSDLVATTLDRVGLDRPAPVGSSVEPPLPATLARRQFVEWIRAAEGRPRRFLQTVVWYDRRHGFEARHEDDFSAPAETLELRRDPEEALAVGRTREEGGYRALTTAPDLRRGWRFAGLDADELWEVYARLYPGAPVHWFLRERGTFETKSFAEVAVRQTGMYAGLGALNDTAIDSLVRRCCDSTRCLRDPTWRAGRGATRSSVPCPRPCSILLTEARQMSGAAS